MRLCSRRLFIIFRHVAWHRPMHFNMYANCEASASPQFVVVSWNHRQAVGSERVCPMSQSETDGWLPLRRYLHNGSGKWKYCLVSRFALGKDSPPHRIGHPENYASSVAGLKDSPSDGLSFSCGFGLFHVNMFANKGLYERDMRLCCLWHFLLSLACGLLDLIA